MDQNQKRSVEKFVTPLGFGLSVNYRFGKNWTNKQLAVLECSDSYKASTPVTVSRDLQSKARITVSAAPVLAQ